MKLVRNLIPQLLTKKGIPFTMKVLDDQEYAIALQKKFQEELTEYMSAESCEQQFEELVDILEVIHAVVTLQGREFSDLEQMRLAKGKQRGYFFGRIGCEVRACPFCHVEEQSMVAKFAHCFVIRDRFPVSPGHSLIVPYAHIENWFEAQEFLRAEMIQVLQQMKGKLDEQFKPDGYNFGVNCGEMAGQSVKHLHLHLIPRYKGDMVDPKGGVRGVIPSKQSYG